MSEKRVLARVGLCRRLLLAAGAIALPLVGAGCADGHYRERTVYRERVYVETAPPPDRYEVTPVRPSVEHVWIHGHHTYRGGTYVWVGGRYEVPPFRGARYEYGRWERDGSRHFWIEGGWR